MSWEPSYIVTLFLMCTSVFTSLFWGITQNFSFFVCISPWIWLLKDLTFFFSKFYEDLRNELGNIHVYLHLFSRPFSLYKYFLSVLAIDLMPRTPNFFLKKSLWGPPRVRELSCMLTLFLMPISAYTSHFFGIT